MKINGTRTTVQFIQIKNTCVTTLENTHRHDDHVVKVDYFCVFMMKQDNCKAVNNTHPLRSKCNSCARFQFAKWMFLDICDPEKPGRVIADPRYTTLRETKPSRKGVRMKNSGGSVQDVRTRLAKE